MKASLIRGFIHGTVMKFIVLNIIKYKKRPHHYDDIGILGFILIGIMFLFTALAIPLVIAYENIFSKIKPLSLNKK